jgi:predicted CopG family antitoxin
MGKTITIEDDAYKLLASLKEGPGDSFSKVIRRHVYAPARSNAEILEDAETRQLPKADPRVLEIVEKGRGRRSGGRR